MARHILVTGASGLIGSALLPALREAGHAVTPLKRSHAPPPPGGATWNVEANRFTIDAGCAPDVVVHLAGETVGQRWTATSKGRMWESRCQGTRALCDALLRLPRPPSTLLCASATGYYGNRGADWVDETASAGEGFLSDLAQVWENSAQPARDAGMRVVHLRFGIVLCPEGGALARMLPPFRLGIAGKLGDGRQYWSWITRADVIRAMMHVLPEETLNGPVNVVSPNPATNQEFTRTLGAVLHRPTFLAMPAFMVRTIFGQMGKEMLLAGVRVKPARLVESGFSFQQPELQPALEQMLGQ